MDVQSVITTKNNSNNNKWVIDTGGPYPSPYPPTNLPKTGDTLLTPLGLRVSMSDGNRLPSGDLSVRLLIIPYQKNIEPISPMALLRFH